ncbi:cysteine hydrolase family protein [Eudoraea chungangensis]|uniref:cysteine hydrolase family protein n=1 Tax=Eudoraea chungangensis TaxID=1481905 RepID=UPI0023ED7A2F|nr:cysteine hydrolase family protein [Eudoraea chungangensis]
MPNHHKNNTALLLIDIQKGLDDLSFYGGKRNNPDAEEKAKKILDYWRAKGHLIIHIKHNSTSVASPLAKGKKGNAIKEIVKPLPKEIVIEKEVNSAFIETSLEKILLTNSIETLVIAGLTTEHCISSTVRMGANLGFNCVVISDATASFNKTNKEGEEFSADLVHKVSLASLQGEFAEVIKAEELVSRYKE